MENIEVMLEDVIEQLENALKNDDLYLARQLCADILVNFPEQPDATKILGIVSAKIGVNEAIRRFPGAHYREWLSAFHRVLKPRGYLEIGIAGGNTLTLAREPSLAIGVDPAFKIECPLHARTQLFRTTSDRFFLDYDIKKLWGGDILDMAFLDGLHTFDQTLRDFMNVERDGHKQTVVLVHDIFPVEPITAMRERISQFWLGDTWKLIPILRRFRPDLKVFTIPTYPSGLAVISNLDPSSEILANHFDAIVAEYMTHLDEEIENAEAHLNVIPATPAAVFGAIGAAYSE